MLKARLTGLILSIGLATLVHPLPKLAWATELNEPPLEASEVHWPAFRGPHANGHALDAKDAPLHWSETEGIVWKTEIPYIGWSSPTIMGDQIWLTTATKDGSDFYAIQVDANTGEIEYNESIFQAEDPEPLGNAVNGYASPSPALEPGRVYLHFGTYGTACLDTDTKEILWKREDINIRHLRGPGASPILFEDLLILNMDGIDFQYQTALYKDTGKTAWITNRTAIWNDFDRNGIIIREGDKRKSFSTPIIVEANGAPLLISPGSFAVYGYDPRNGREIFKARHNSYTPQVRPAFLNGVVYGTTGFEPTEFMAVRVDGKGDVTDTHILWRIKDNRISLTPSPTIVDDLLYLTGDKGTVTCLDPETGEQVWEERIGGNYVASPLYAAGRLYFFSTQGKTTIMKPGRNPEILAENRLDDGLMASAAMLGSSLIIRTKTHLYRIDTK